MAGPRLRSLWDPHGRYQPAICTSMLPSLLRRGLNGRAAVIAIDVGRHAVGRVAGFVDLPRVLGRRGKRGGF